MMPQFTKKPVVIEAVQWAGDNFHALVEWGAPVTIMPATGGASLIIGTLEDGPNCEAVHVASLHDWIIRGVKGEFYPCKPDIFEATYAAGGAPQLRTNADLELLKKQWLADPCWDIENTEGFEAHRHELEAFHLRNLLEWRVENEAEAERYGLSRRGLVLVLDLTKRVEKLEGGSRV